LLAESVQELRTRSYLFVFMAAVVISLRLVGILSGFFSIVLSVAAVAYMMPPEHSFRISDPADIYRLGMFTVVSLMVLAIYGSRGRSEAELRIATDVTAKKKFERQQQLWRDAADTVKFSTVP
jgi:K+-sensing histidine kinase KdpD